MANFRRCLIRQHFPLIKIAGVIESSWLETINPIFVSPNWLILSRLYSILIDLRSLSTRTAIFLLCEISCNAQQLYKIPFTARLYAQPLCRIIFYFINGLFVRDWMSVVHLDKSSSLQAVHRCYFLSALPLLQNVI